MISVKLDGNPGLIIGGIADAIANGIVEDTKTAGAVLVQHIKLQVKAFAEKRTGRLENSFSVQVKRGGSGGGAIAVVTSNVPYARIHETGGTITPKRASALAIPLTGAARVSGGPRNMAGLFVAKGKRSGAVLALRGGGGGIVPQFALRRSVTLPARHYLTKAAKAATDMIGKRVADQVRQQIRKAVGGRR